MTRKRTQADAQAIAEERIAEAAKRLAGDLALDGLGLTSLPESLLMLSDSLRLLFLLRNRLTHLPPWFSKLQELEIVDLADNLFERFPAPLSRLPRLTQIFIGNNRLKVLPEWIGTMSQLTLLDIGQNQLRTLPRALLALPRLNKLNVGGNAGLNMPAELVLSANAQRLLSYYFRTIESASAASPLNEFKLVLVGRGGVGKTSLVHRLVTGKYETFTRTPGVNITDWPLDINGEDVRAHVWDFGGQEIMHGTHRFFMTERALYLVLISGREGTEDQDAEYWLSLIRSFAGDVPVIVLQHKSGDYSFELNRELLKEKYGKELLFLETDSHTGAGLDQLQEAICRRAAALPGLKAAWPTEWRSVKEEIPAKKRSWVTFDDFRQFCAEHGVSNPADQEALADSLHDLGLMLSYRRDETLRDFGVLNPQWVTDGIYQMLNAPSLRESNGKFTIASFGEILPSKRYPERLHPYLLALMRKFQLCHPLDDQGTTYLIPELLTKEEPASLDTEFPPDQSLGFVYTYDAVLPEGLLPRFIVESYVHREPKRAWRTGVVLERANCRALVRGDVQGRKVTIRVTGTGNGKRELLGIVREHFERIHRSYEKLPVTEHVPIPRRPEAMVRHDLLLKYERARRETIPIELGDELIDWPVKELLDGVDIPGAPRHGMERELNYWTATNIFISYAHKDEKFLDELRGALTIDERLGRIKVWADPLIAAGEEWERAIFDRIDRADIVILLLSNDFIASRYAMDKELPRAVEREKKGECTIIPVVVRSCAFEKLPLGKIQAIQPKRKPINKHRDRDAAWLEVTKQLDRVIDRAPRV